MGKLASLVPHRRARGAVLDELGGHPAGRGVELGVAEADLARHDGRAVVERGRRHLEQQGEVHDGLSRRRRLGALHGHLTTVGGQGTGTGLGAQHLEARLLVGVALADQGALTGCVGVATTRAVGAGVDDLDTTTGQHHGRGRRTDHDQLDGALRTGEAAAGLDLHLVPSRGDRL